MPALLPRGRGRVLKFKIQINGTFRHNSPLCQTGEDRRIFANFSCIDALDTHGFFAVFVQLITGLIPGAHGQLIAAHERAALRVDVSCPVSRIGGVMRGSKLNAW